MGEFSFSDHKYIREFEDALNSISAEVRPASNMAVLSDDFATRKPYWTWLRHKAIGQLKGNPHLIMEFFGLKDIPAPDIFAWYCTIYHSFQFLWSSSSCFSDNKPTQWGITILNFLHTLTIDYGVDEKFISKKSALSLYTALVSPDLFSSIPNIDKNSPSSYSQRKAAGTNETIMGCGCLTAILVLIFVIVFFFDKSY